ncbi:MAG: YbaK/EbsC family protein [Patescibacteria group bacterium]
MAIPKKVESFFKSHNVAPEIVTHKTVYTVYDLAQTLREKFDSIAKTLLVKADRQFLLVVMPANYRLDIQKLKKAIKAKKITLASERDMKTTFHAIPGAMMPFGALHKLEVVADASLLKAKHALFSAGSFTESVRMKMKDYLRIAEPRIEHIAKKVPMKLTVVRAKPTKKKRRAQPKKRKTVRRGKRR